MSALLFRANGVISNPFVLCALVSARSRQLTKGGRGERSTAEIVDYALGELLAGFLQYQMPGEKESKSNVRTKGSTEVDSQHIALAVC